MFIEWHLILKGFSNKISDGPKRHCGRWGRFFLNVYGWQELFYLIKKRTSSVEFIKQQKKKKFSSFFLFIILRGRKWFYKLYRNQYVYKK